MFRIFQSMLLCAVMLGCSSPKSSNAADNDEGTQAAAPLQAGQAEAIFAGGCFWCMEKPFEVIDGVVSVESGYTGGDQPNPTYKQVSYHRTNHIEAIRVVYDPQAVDYDRLLEVFWHNIDPIQSNGQFCDKGEQYRTAIFTSNVQELQAANKSKDRIAQQLNATVDTRILPKSTFWVAEDYHQDFYKTNPTHYKRYRQGCGRDARLQQLWGDAAGH